MKKLSFLVATILLFAYLALPGQAATAGSPDFDVGAQGVYLYNMDTGSLIWERNMDQQMYPASLTKIMTCILALENISNLDTEIVTYPDYVQDYLYRYGLEHGQVSLGGLIAGEELTMRQALYAMMLPSANEVAMSVADHIGGSQQGFVDMMNARAKELGATNTNFVNPNGLHDPEHVTTPRDMALITMHAMSLPVFMDIVTTTSYDSGETNKHDNLVWSTTNQMMVQGNSYYYPYIQGIKTGTLPQSGRCFVSSATKDGFTYLLVLMNAPYLDADGDALAGNAAFVDAGNLFDWVFSTFRVKSLVEQYKYVEEIPLNLSLEQDHIKVMTADRFTALVPSNIEASSVTMVFDLPDSVDAPVTKGDYLGTARLILAGEEIGIVELQSAETVSASTPLVILQKARDILRSFWFKFGLIFFILLIILYVVLMIAKNKRRKRMGSYKSRRRI